MFDQIMARLRPQRGRDTFMQSERQANLKMLKNTTPHEKKF